MPGGTNRTFNWQDAWATLAGGLLFLAFSLAARTPINMPATPRTTPAPENLIP